MSVQTTADMYLNHVYKDVNTSIQNLSSVIVHQCEGHDEYAEHFIVELNESLMKLLEVRKTLKNYA